MIPGFCMERSIGVCAIIRGRIVMRPYDPYPLLRKQSVIL